MFKKSQPANEQSETRPETSAPVVKYQRPKILLIDLEADVKKALEMDGYNVAAGTFE
jgi:hypothetical protein